MKKRNKCVSLCAALLLALVISGTAAWCSDSDSASVTLTIPDYIYVEVGNIYNWGQGLTGIGEPNTTPPSGGDGEEPTFPGGTLDDWWPNDDQVEYCDGATGRAMVTVGSNRGTVRVGVKATSYFPVLNHTTSSGHTLNARAVLGWTEGSANILPGVERTLSGLHGTDTSTWLYICVERKGLLDVAGTYEDTVVLYLYAQ